jgi:beta-phosphoglucomutase-like phosphatase (HAD superfamily)
MASGALCHEIETILKTVGLFRSLPRHRRRRGRDPRQTRAGDLFKSAHGGNGKPIEAADCAVIEDSKEGIKGALRAGMKCLAVTNSHPAELLSEADAVVKSLEVVKLKFLQNMCP